MSPSLNVEVPVFADTNLGTRFVTAVSPDIRAGDLKRELEKAHSICFPELGNIDVSSLLVRQKSSFYHLPDSIHVKNACQPQGIRNPWFLHVYARSIKDSQRFCIPKHHAGRTSDITHKVTRGEKTDKNHPNHKRRRKRRKRIWHIKALMQGLALTACMSGNKRRWHILRNCPVRCTPNDLEQKDAVLNGRVSDKPRLEGCHEQQEIQTVGELGRMSETPGASSSGVVSVSGIITKYFTNLIELDRPDSPSSSNATSVAVQTQMEGQIQRKMGNSQAIMSAIDMPQFVDETPQGIVPPPPTVNMSGTDEAPQSFVPPPPIVRKSGTDETPHSNVPPLPTVMKSRADETPQSIVPPPPTVKRSETDETPHIILPSLPTWKKPRFQTSVVRKCSTEAANSIGTSRAKQKHQQSCYNKPVTSEIRKYLIVASNSLDKSQSKHKSQIGLDRPNIPSCSDAASTAIQPQTEGQTRPTMGNSHSNMPTNDMPQFVERTAQSILPIPPTAKKPTSQTPVIRKRVRVASNSIGPSLAKLKTRKSCCDQSVTPEVGKRLISASNNLKKSHAKQKSLMCFYKSQKRNVLGSNTRSPVRHLVFEISDDDDD